MPQREVSGFLVDGHRQKKLGNLGQGKQKKPTEPNHLVPVQMMSRKYSLSRPTARVKKKEPSQMPKNVKFDDSNA